MNYSREEVLEIVREMLGENIEGIYIPSEEFELGVSDAFPISNTDYGAWDIENTDEVEVYRGATKIVFVPAHKDYAIKLNISGTYLTEDECKDANYLYPHIDRISTKDVLEEENVIFEDLSDELKELIFPNIYVGKYEEISVYIQKKIKKTYDEAIGAAWIRYSNEGKKRIESVHRALKRSTPFGLNWAIHAVLPEPFISDMIDFYGEEKVEYMLQHLVTSGIDDLNYSNFGYDINDKPCIFDIAGFNEVDFFDYDEHFYDSQKYLILNKKERML